MFFGLGVLFVVGFRVVSFESHGGGLDMVYHT